MKSPKFVVSYPNSHKLSYGGHTMTTWTGTSDGVSISHKYDRYKPLTGSVSSQMRIFSSFNDAERWAKGL